MKKNSLLKKESDNGIKVYRILEIEGEQVFVTDCIHLNMPKWVNVGDLKGYAVCEEEELSRLSGYRIVDIESLDAKSRKIMYERYTVIAGILPFVTDKKRRNEFISEIAETNHICKQTVRNYLCLYLAHQDISIFAPVAKEDRELTEDEKHMRYAVNHYYYTKNKNSLNTAYTMMLQKFYCDESAKLLPDYPTFNQFRYFFRKYRNRQTELISREGIKAYERNHRPLTGDKVQQYASHVGIGMFDATVCDIYLVDESNNLIGRPVLTACVDGFSSLCMGYSLSWEGGTYSLRGLMLNVITDKVKHCKKHGIVIDKSDWNCCQLPAQFVTDRGSEYISATFEQIVDLGVTLVNLPSYRAELKGVIEKFFDLIQDSFKPYLKGKGLIEPDFQERGARDYRKDACLTMADFEKIILRCILYYNSKRMIANYPYSEMMLSAQVQPFANCIWEWGKQQMGANLMDVDRKDLILVLLPRTQAKFSRYGLRVNKLRYHCEGYTEQYLKGDSCIVAYNPDDVSVVWLYENGKYIPFNLIESRFGGKPLVEVQDLQKQQKDIVKSVAEQNLQAKIDLAEHIQAISAIKDNQSTVNIKGVRKTKKREQDSTHIDYAKEGNLNEQ